MDSVKKQASSARSAAILVSRFAGDAEMPASHRLFAMETGTQASGGHDEASVNLELASVSVALLLEAFDPRIVNPRFLRRKRVVPVGFVHDAQRTYANPESAQVVYGASHQVSADRGSLTFEQFGYRMVPREVDVPGIARKFLGAAEAAYCTAFGIIFGGFVEGPRLSDEHVAALLQTGTPRVQQEGPIARVEINITYQLEDKMIFLNISDFTLGETGAQRDGVLYRATFHRDTPDVDPSTLVREKLATWEDDLGEFRSLAQRFSAAIKP